MRRHKLYTRGTEQEDLETTQANLCPAVDEYGLIDDDNDEPFESSRNQ